MLRRPQRKKRNSIVLPLAAIAGLVSLPAHAITALKKVEVTDGSQVNLYFDGKVGKNQVRVDFLNDVIQLSLSDVAVYPAKIFSVSGDELTKVFAYQYAPKLVRCRLTVKGKAEEYRNRVNVAYNGKNVLLRLSSGTTATKSTDKVETSAAQAVKKTEQPSEASALQMSGEEKKLLERVIQGSAAAQAAPPAPAKETAAPARSEERVEAKSPPASSKHLTGGGGEMGFGKVLGKFMLVLGLLGGLLLALKKLKDRNGLKRRELSGMLGRFIRKAGFSGSPKLIEVVATHYLGPKKSIAVVKVCGRMLVLGVSNESINLITQLSGDSAGSQDTLESIALESLGMGGLSNLEEPKTKAPVAEPASGALSAGRPTFNDFSSILGSEKTKPASNVRAQIRSRIEGMKQL